MGDDVGVLLRLHQVVRGVLVGLEPQGGGGGQVRTDPVVLLVPPPDELRGDVHHELAIPVLRHLERVQLDVLVVRVVVADDVHQLGPVRKNLGVQDSRDPDTLLGLVEREHPVEGAGLPGVAVPVVPGRHDEPVLGVGGVPPILQRGHLEVLKLRKTQRVLPQGAHVRLWDRHVRAGRVDEPPNTVLGIGLALGLAHELGGDRARVKLALALALALDGVGVREGGKLVRQSRGGGRGLRLARLHTSAQHLLEPLVIRSHLVPLEQHLLLIVLLALVLLELLALLALVLLELLALGLLALLALLALGLLALELQALELLPCGCGCGCGHGCGHGLLLQLHSVVVKAEENLREDRV